MAFINLVKPTTNKRRKHIMYFLLGPCSAVTDSGVCEQTPAAECDRNRHMWKSFNFHSSDPSQKQSQQKTHELTTMYLVCRDRACPLVKKTACESAVLKPHSVEFDSSCWESLISRLLTFLHSLRLLLSLLHRYPCRYSSLPRTRKPSARLTCTLIATLPPTTSPGLCYYSTAERGKDRHDQQLDL